MMLSSVQIGYRQMMLSSVQIGYRRLVATLREQLNHADHFKQLAFST